MKNKRKIKIGIYQNAKDAKLIKNLCDVLKDLDIDYQVLENLNSIDVDIIVFFKNDIENNFAFIVKCLDKKIPIITLKHSKLHFLKNYDPENFAGNAFLYNKENIYHILKSIILASSNFVFVEDWNNIKKNIEKDY